MAINGTHNGTVHNKIVGTVEQANDTGVKVGGAWLNYSKFAPNLTPPPRGAYVAVQLDGQGFVRAIEAADGAVTTATQSPVGGRETAITRLAVLKAAAEFAASRADLKSGDVLRIAESWEGWVTR